MSDDLVKRLRAIPVVREAADRIEALEAALAAYRTAREATK